VFIIDTSSHERSSSDGTDYILELVCSGAGMFLNSLAGKQKHVNVIQHLVSHSLKSDAKGSSVSSHLESRGSAS